jgi:hypothetical protein
MSDCACLYGGDDFDYDEGAFSHCVMRTARKMHACSECNRTIGPGERYEHYSGKFDGRIFAVKTCLACADIRGHLYCGSYSFGELWGDIHSQIFERDGLTISCLDKLSTVAGKEKLQHAYAQWIAP